MCVHVKDKLGGPLRGGGGSGTLGQWVWLSWGVGVALIYSVHCIPDSVAKHVYKSLPANLHIASAKEERASKSSAEGKLLYIYIYTTSY